MLNANYGLCCKKPGLIFVRKVEITLKYHWKAQHPGSIFARMRLYTFQDIEINGVVASLSRAMTWLQSKNY